MGVISTNLSAYTSESTPGTSVVEASATLATIINNGAAQVPSFDPLTEPETQQLIEPLDALDNEERALNDVLIAAKADFDGYGLSGEVLDTLRDQETASEGLRDVLVPKISENLQHRGSELAGCLLRRLIGGCGFFGLNGVFLGSRKGFDR